MRRNTNTPSRPVAAISLLLALILPASLITGGLAAADTTTSQPVIATGPTMTGNNERGNRQTSRVARQNSVISPSSAISTTPQSSLPAPSPLNTASPLTPTPPLLTSSSSPKATTSKPGKSDDNPHQTRSTQHTVTFKDDSTTLSKQSIADGTRARRPPKDPARDSYLFDGWFIKDAKGDSNVAYDFSQPVTKDFTLTAHWTKGTSTWSISPTSGPAAGGDKTTLTPPLARGIRLSQADAGDVHSGAVGSDGNIYTWGDNQKNQLGRTVTSNTPANRPNKVETPAGITFTQDSAGYGFSVALGSDGNLYSWGDNGLGQLGRTVTSNTPANRPNKVETPAGITFTSVSAGRSYAVAVSSEGNLYSWGDNSAGRLGRDTTGTSDPKPSQVQTTPAGINFTSVSAGWGHTAALDSQGNIYTWGDNTHGELGRSTVGSTQGNYPGKVDTPTGITFTQASAGGSHSVAVSDDGSLYTWGNSDNGRLGRDTNNTPAGKPGKADNPTGITFTQASAGGWHTVAVSSDGNLYTWGDSDHGRLGRDTSKTPADKPGKADNPTGITFTQASAGAWYCFAQGSDGNLYSWGDNTNGQLGRDTSSTQDASLVKVDFPENPRPVSVSFGGTPGTSLVGNKDGTWSVTTPQHAAGKTDVTVSWSMNGQQPDAHLFYRYLGSYTVAFDSTGGNPVPDQRITEGRQATRPTADPARDGFLFDGWFLKDAKGGSKVAYDFSQPVTADITLVAHWSPEKGSGWSISPGKGNVLGGQRATITPPRLGRGIRFSQVSAGGYQMSDAAGFSVGVASDGNAYAWGSNQHGQLGIGNKVQQSKPVRVPLPAGVASGFTYTQAAAGGFHVLAVGSDGIVYSWGANDHGQLGDGTTVERSKPQPVPDPNDTSQPFKAVQVSAGAYDSAAISPDGRVYTWGSEGNSRDGNFNPSFTPPRKTPTLAAAPDGSGQGLQAVRVSLGWSFIMALDADGNVYAWGYNNYGQLGNNSTSSAYTATPARVRDPNSPNDPSKGLQATQISAGTDHGLAIDRNGTVLSWGHNNQGQLGNGSTYDKLVPEPVKNPGGRGSFTAVGISTGVIYSLAVDSSGNTWAWGYNAYGQLGNGDVFALLTPTSVRSPDPSAGASASLQATRVSAAQYHSLAIGQDGNAYAWGDNRLGQLGNGSLTQSRTPTLVAFNPALLITGVKFDKTVVNPLVQNPDGSVTLSTPVHNPGLADVAVDWTLGGTKQEPAHLAYTYEGVLPLTGGSGSTVLLLAAGLLAVAGAAAAGRHRREARALHV